MTQIADITIPSKWDIIPLHTSDRGTFKQCRRKWYWSSPAQANLIPKQSIFGIYKPFWFGTGIHYALEKYYQPVLSEDPEITFDSWFDIQWNGGIIKEDELEQFKDRRPFLNKDGEWEIYGLEEILPDPDPDGFEELHQIGLGMMKFYKNYAEREDNFDVISSEHQFSVPVIDPGTGKPLYMVDTRQMPEDWEPDLDAGNDLGPFVRKLDYDMGDPYEKQVHARGRMDLIVQGRESGNFVIIDHKTTDRIIDDDYFAHVDLDEQVTTYAWAAEVEAKLYGLPYEEIAGVVYQALRKSYPKPPTITTRGLPSLNRQTETTTVQLFDETIKDLNIESWLRLDEKAQAYYTYLIEKGDKQFIDRRDVPRNKAQKNMAGLRIYMEALDMLENPRIYPNPTKDYACLNCAFRGPCIAMESGFDYEAMIADGYETNFDR